MQDLSLCHLFLLFCLKNTFFSHQALTRWSPGGWPYVGAALLAGRSVYCCAAAEKVKFSTGCKQSSWMSDSPSIFFLFCFMLFCSYGSLHTQLAWLARRASSMCKTDTCVLPFVPSRVIEPALQRLFPSECATHREEMQNGLIIVYKSDGRHNRCGSICVFL